MFFKTYVITHPECSNIDLNLVGNMIIGYIDKSLKNQAFMVEIINGAFDADKIDYIQRDSHFTGIKMVLDLPRLFYTINIVKKDNYYRLCVDINGVATLEQIIFNKMMLYSTVYHHQKVRAATSLVKGVLNTLRSDAKITLYGKDFKSAADFLELTDNNIYEIAKKDIEFITTEVKSLCNRKLPMRTVAVSAKSIDKRDSFSDLASFLEDNEFSDVETQNILKEAIAEVAKEKNPDILPQDIYIDFPKLPNFKEASTCLIKDTDETITLRKVFPMEDWVKAFSENKYRGYIFTKNEYREDVFESTREVFQEAFQVDLLPLAKALCKF
ncbi:MAG: hypothetical protein LBD23_05105 [Oscillospiraceae bacterium]|nr:hypothetical protein [Oscillospiraceae bacterium]